MRYVAVCICSCVQHQIRDCQKQSVEIFHTLYKVMKFNYTVFPLLYDNGKKMGFLEFLLRKKKSSMFVDHNRVSRYHLMNDKFEVYMIYQISFQFCYTLGHEHLYRTMEIEKQEMYFVVLGRKKCDFLNFTTLSFTFSVDIFCKSQMNFIKLLDMLSEYIKRKINKE